MKRINALGCCFLADTKVVTPIGNLDISRITVGQMVSSCDLKSSQLTTGRVSKTEVDIEPAILRIHFSQDSLICTPSQRLWLGSGWVLAGSLRVGDVVAGLTCQSIMREDWGKSVHTLVVEPWNNYVVITALGTAVVAHDNSSDIGYPAGLGEIARSSAM